MADTDLGLRIRRAREAKGWRQEDLAARMPKRPDGRQPGVRSIGRWERGEAVPRNAIGALEEVLGVSLTTSQEPADAERDKAMLHDSIDRMDVRDLAKMVEAYRKLERNGTPARRDRAG